jgi:hypothetical protein
MPASLLCTSLRRCRYISKIPLPYSTKMFSSYFDFDGTPVHLGVLALPIYCLGAKFRELKSPPLAIKMTVAGG